MDPLQDTRFDDEGYLTDPCQWHRPLAESIASEVGIDLQEAHWEVVSATRRFYATYRVSPAMRTLVKYLGQELGPEKGRSIYLLALFRSPVTSDSPARIIARIAGLPKPDNCL